MTGLSRRRFLYRALAALVVSASGFLGWRRWSGGKAAARERETLTALADTIVPEDDFPGAVQAGVPALLERRLARFESSRHAYHEGFELLDRASVASHGAPFSRLPPAARTEILERIFAGAAQGERGVRVFVNLARRDILRAFYSTPEARSMLGYRPPREGYADA